MINKTFLTTDNPYCIYKSLCSKKFNLQMRFVNKMNDDIEYRIYVVSKNGVETNILDVVLANSTINLDHKIRSMSSDNDIYVTTNTTGLLLYYWEPLIL
jgi:hypothetical protein